MKKILVITVLLLGLLLSGCFDQKDKQDDTLVQEGITLHKVNGSPVDVLFVGNNRKKNMIFQEARGKVILTVYWSTSCPPCRAEIPHLIELQKKYKDKLKIYGLLVQQKDREELKEFMEYFGINYDILYGNENYEMANIMGGVDGIPAMFLLNKQGKIVQHYVGLVPPEMLEAEIIKHF